MVAAASAGAVAVRKADPAHYPPAPHAYFRLGDNDLMAPLLCAVCFEQVEPNNLFQVSTDRPERSCQNSYSSLCC